MNVKTCVKIFKVGENYEIDQEKCTKNIVINTRNSIIPTTNCTLLKVEFLVESLLNHSVLISSTYQFE